MIIINKWKKLKSSKELSMDHKVLVLPQHFNPQNRIYKKILLKQLYEFTLIKDCFFSENTDEELNLRNHIE